MPVDDNSARRDYLAIGATDQDRQRPGNKNSKARCSRWPKSYIGKMPSNAIAQTASGVSGDAPGDAEASAAAAMSPPSTLR